MCKEKTTKELFNINKKYLINLFPSLKEAVNNHQKTNILIDGIKSLENIIKDKKEIIITLKQSNIHLDEKSQQAIKDYIILKNEQDENSSKLHKIQTKLRLEQDKNIILEYDTKALKDNIEILKDAVELKAHDILLINAKHKQARINYIFGGILIGISFTLFFIELYKLLTV